jgi:hypothetical protein
MPSQHATTVPKSDVNDQGITHVVSALEGLRYGSIEIIIHDSRIVQIERREKFRFDRDR